MAITETMDQVSQQAEKFQSLSSTQLNWKPSENEWSIGQCLDHLIVSNTTYFPTFEKVLHGKYRLGFLQKINQISVLSVVTYSKPRFVMMKEILLKKIVLVG